ncbi:hypothetical protein IAE35_17805 [Pseudomonas sp. S75]|uniref:hypothetical protein n=1 Tax=unclassified Pseudomonas TaxID=196821 RepID=UPI001905CEF1|nr:MULTISPECIES: hypothetical protein [unclassified Pseudomonas]MBJ9977538.1 hypothetical protein [Pseudomonas sp. S30]MBK0155201.1 hypothetical protein [Pseudomonas sp. S75]
MNLTSFLPYPVHACLAVLRGRAAHPAAPRLAAFSGKARDAQLRAVRQTHPGPGKHQLHPHERHDDAQEPPGPRESLERLRARLTRHASA